MLDLFTADFNSLTNYALFSAIADFARAQPGESYRHDFKSIWNSDTLKDVAAFANTFGGILIIGVNKNQKDIEAKLIGESSSSERKTVIASAIATNISPTPSYDIAECYKPDEPTKRFCVIRISSDAKLHIVTKKDIHTRVLIRNVDVTLPADGAQLRMMIDRERQSIGNTDDGSLPGRAFHLLTQMPIGEMYASLQDWPGGNHQMSGTYFKLALIPTENRIMHLHRRHEKQFIDGIHANYRRVRSSISADVVKDTENRNADFYQYQWYHKNLDYECRWRITNRLEVAHATQIKQDDMWSLADVVVYTILMLRVGAKWWESLNYFGDGILAARLEVPGIKLARGKSDQFLSLFAPSVASFVLSPEVLEVAQQQGSGAQAGLSLNFADMLGGIPESVTAIMNSLLRALGHGVFWAEFEENVRVIADGMR